MKAKRGAISLAILAAVLYAVSTPFSKLLLGYIEPTMLASLLYFGAGFGMLLVYLVLPRKFKEKEQKLTVKDLPYTVGMILLDIIAPVCLMIGLSSAPASNIALLNNFEIVATSLIALFVFKELISKRLWAAIMLITAASIILSFDDVSSLSFSPGSVMALVACLCWGFENNFTRKLSGKSTYEIVILKGLFSGLGSLIIAFIMGEGLPGVRYLFLALVLGFAAYGLSIFVYIRAQKDLGAAKTSSFYAIAPFIGAFISVIILNEPLTASLIVAVIIMVGGTVLVVRDTLMRQHSHLHIHTITHTHDGSTHTHVIEHSHSHEHVEGDGEHLHRHRGQQLLINEK